jgi:hypothetical protein
MDSKSIFYHEVSFQPAEQSWAPPRPSFQLVERPLVDIISAKLGIAKGSAELFSYRLQSAPSNAAVLDGVVGGTGIKLKLIW